MTRSQRYIDALMENVSEGQLASDEHRLVFGKIREKLAGAEDYDHELRTLFKVTGLGDFALSLMWISDRVDHDPSKAEYTPEEQLFVVNRFRAAVGDTEPAPLEEFFGPQQTPAAPQEVAETFAATPENVIEAPPEPPEPAEETPAMPEMPQHLQMEAAGHIDESEKAVYAPPAGPVSGSEGEFASLMEKFVEAMQSGSDERESLLKAVVEQSSAIVPAGSGAPDDLREFCQCLLDFLNYITENGFMDDVRVMNILSNVSSPVSSWAQSAPDARSGLLAEGTEILRTFKSLFE